MEGNLGKLENDWASFCEKASNVKSELEDKYGRWKEFRSDCDKMMIMLSEFENNLKPEIRRGFDLQGIDIELKKLKVCYELYFLDSCISLLVSYLIGYFFSIQNS